MFTVAIFQKMTGPTEVLKVFLAHSTFFLIARAGFSNHSLPPNPVLKHLVDLLNSSVYDKTLRPHADDHPLVATLHVALLDVTGVSQTEGYFLADIAVIQIWHDPQLAYDAKHFSQLPQNVTVQPNLADNIWTPNICFVNSKQARMHLSPAPNVLLQVMPNGTVWLQYRIQAQGPCDIDLSKFPMDVQGCTLIFESYSYNAQEVELEWAGWQKSLVKNRDRYRMPDFILTAIGFEKAQLEYTAGIWDQLLMKLTFRRKMGYYMLQAYVPTYVCVIVSWVAFYLDATATAARTSLGVNTLMALVINFGNVNADMPRVSYMRAIDVWMFACMLLTFGTLLEYALVGYVDRRRYKKLIQQKDARINRFRENRGIISTGETNLKQRHLYVMAPKVRSNGTVRYILTKAPNPPERRKSSRGMEVKECDVDMMSGLRGCDIDAISAKLFPVIFLVFNGWYWCHYML